MKKLSTEASERLDRWMKHLPEEPSDEELDDALERWARGEEPPVKPS